MKFFIVPFFALVNTNITFSSEIVHGLAIPLGIGIIIVLLFDQPAGVLPASDQVSTYELSQYANWRHMVGMGLLAGTDFTMSLFMALLSFTETQLIAEAKILILCASVLSATIGYVLLSMFNLWLNLKCSRSMR